MSILSILKKESLDLFCEMYIHFTHQDPPIPNFSSALCRVLTFLFTFLGATKFYAQAILYMYIGTRTTN